MKSTCPPLLAFSLFLCTQASATDLREAGESRNACVLDQLLRFDGLPLTSRRQTVEKKLGKPKGVSKGYSEDDGGKYPVSTLTFDQLAVSFGRGSVELVIITGPNHSLANGVRIGMNEFEVGPRLGFIPDSKEGNYTVKLRSCSDYEGPQVFLHFTSTGVPSARSPVLRKIEIEKIGP